MARVCVTGALIKGKPAPALSLLRSGVLPPRSTIIAPAAPVPRARPIPGGSGFVFSAPVSALRCSSGARVVLESRRTFTVPSMFPREKGGCLHLLRIVDPAAIHASGRRCKQALLCAALARNDRSAGSRAQGSVPGARETEYGNRHTECGGGRSAAEGRVRPGEGWGEGRGGGEGGGRSGGR